MKNTELKQMTRKEEASPNFQPVGRKQVSDIVAKETTNQESVNRRDSINSNHSTGWSKTISEELRDAAALADKTTKHTRETNYESEHKIGKNDKKRNDRK